MALAFIVTLAAGWWFFRPDAQPASEDGAGPVRTGVLIAPFENRTQEPELDNLGQMAGDWIARALNELREVQVLQVPRIVTADEILPGSLEDSEEATPLMTLTDESGVELLVWGSYYVQGDSVYIQARLTDVRSREQIRTITPVRGSRDDPIDALRKLGERMTVAVASLFDRPFGFLIDASTDLPNSAAYREYKLGIEAWGRDNHEAVDHFIQAASLDTMFLQSLILAAIQMKDWRQWARADSVLEAVDRSRDRLSPANRVFLDMVRGEVRGDWPAVYEAGRRGSEDLGFQAFGNARAAVRVNRPREAVEIMLGLARDQGMLGTWQWWFLTGALHMLGRHREELKEARRARSKNPEGLHEINFEVRALAALGRMEEIRQRLDESLNTRPPDWSPAKLMETGEIKHWSPGNVMETAAIELRAHGYPEAYREAIDRAVDWFESRPEGEKATWYYRREYGRVLYAAERWDEAGAVFEGLAEEFPDHPEFVHFKGYLGAVAARRGDRAEAERISEELRDLNRPYLFGSDTYWRACIAALLGKRKRAVELLRDSITEGHSYLQIAGYPKWELHSDIDLESLRDYEPFQDLLRPKG